MRRRDWQNLLQRRVQRETQALDSVAGHREHERQAAAAMNSAEAMLRSETRRQQSELAALYGAIRGLVLAPERLWRLNEVIAEGAARTAAREQDRQRAAIAHAEAQGATEEARRAYRACHQAVERSRLLDRRLAADEARRGEILGELESDEAAVLARLARQGGHA